MSVSTMPGASRATMMPRLRRSLRSARMPMFSAALLIW